MTGASGATYQNSGGSNPFIVPDPSAAGGSGTGGVVGSGGAAPVVSTPPTLMPVSIDECAATNAAGLDAATTQTLMKGSGSAGMLRWLNPYDGTVFPRGLIAPLLMWDGPVADVVYLHIKSSLFEYKGCLKPTGANQLQIAPMIWKQASDLARGASDPFVVELTASTGGTVSGPVTEKIVIAQATLKGSIFYNSYSTKMLNGGIGQNGAVLRISPGATAAVIIGQAGCTGCHSVSANGQRLTTLNFLTGGGTYSVASGTTAPTGLSATAPDTSFTALSPDGSLYVTNAHQGFPIIGPRTGPTNAGTANAGVFDTTTGAAIPNAGVPTSAMTPAFSPDGSLLAFNDYAIDNALGLAVMSFDQTKRVASGYRKIFHSPNTNYPAWPFILPDNKVMVFALGVLGDFSGGGTGITPLSTAATAPQSDLYFLDVASGQAKVLASAMGYASDQDAASNTTYLPFGAAEETHHNYYPTSSPVAAGGYFWVFFDSFRHYGNLGLQRQLYGTAIDISPDGTYTTDPSHPAFYLTGQEPGTANHRAFTALDPCRKDGDTCATGIDCCGGFCTNGVCGVPPPPPPPPGEPPPPPRCANTDEGCSAGTACCNTTDRCLSGFCSQTVR
ncbi:MAG TPA: hypothetical protein VH062_36385 [Polyangiaceae bacterium]|jgi:hypothetical protein|nr:hypothetical protein [Polyangiaceae bacterium]